MSRSPTAPRPERRVALVLAALLVALRVLFVARRPDLVRSVPDAGLAFAAGALFDVAFAAAVGALVGLVHRLAAPRLATTLASLAAVGLALVAAVETEYFAFYRNRFDPTFVVYLRELRVLGGSIAGEASTGFLALHALLALVAVVALVRLPSAPARFSVGPLAQFALALGLAWAVLAHPRPAQTWFGAMASRSPSVELARALGAPERAVAAPRQAAGDFAEARRFTNPLGAKTFLTDGAPLVHRGARAPAGALGPRPPRLNVVFVMLEGMEAASLARSGGTEGLTPELDRLAEEGTYFRRFFANGAHTPRALDATLCGLAPRLSGAPLSRAQPNMPLACLPGLLRDRGFSTAFVHGGLEGFENRFEFLGHIGFRETLFFEQFGQNLPRANGGWGATDAQTYEQALTWLDARDAAKPFFLTVLSISNHHPFHVPDPALELDHEEARLSNNTIRYADREAGRFVAELRRRGLLDSTVVFLFGDHGLTRSNLNGDPGAATAQRLLARANVPLVVVAPPGLFPRAVIDRVASQNDLEPTVLDLLDADVPQHAMGHSLGWTWAGGGHDLPTFVHDLYSQLAASVTPDSLQITGLDDARESEAAGTWRWTRGDDGHPRAERAPLDHDRDQSLRAVVRAVDTLYGEERWWAPPLAAQAR